MPIILQYITMTIKTMAYGVCFSQPYILRGAMGWVHPGHRDLLLISMDFWTRPAFSSRTLATEVSPKMSSSSTQPLPVVEMVKDYRDYTVCSMFSYMKPCHAMHCHAINLWPIYFFVPVLPGFGKVVAVLKTLWANLYSQMTFAELSWYLRDHTFSFCGR